MKSGVLFVFTLILLFEVQTNLAEEFVCQPDLEYIINSCMTCTCISKGNYICPLVNCFDGTEKCINAKKPFLVDCNKCWCVKGKGTFCTTNKC